MVDASARFSLPFIQPGQAQKEWFHNEALARVDGLLHPAIEAADIDTPPASPALGAAWIVGPAPEGDWAGHAGDIASWTSGGWRYVAPVAGMSAWLAPEGAWVWHDGTAWRSDPLPCFGIAVGGVQVLGARSASIAGPAGGATIDVEARAAIDAILWALRGHGLIAS